MNKRPIDDAFRLGREIEAAKILRANLASLTDDEEAVRDTVEGELSLRELIGKVAAEIGEGASSIEAISNFVTRLEGRKKRMKDGIEFKRTLICNAMEQAGIKSLETEAGVVTVKAVAPSLMVTDESKIPSQFWVSKEPTLDKAALKKALAEKVDIAGAELSNGGQTIQIRI